MKTHLFSLCLVASLAALSLPASAATLVWSGGAGNGLYDTGTNWSTGSAPTASDTATFGGTGSTAATTVTLAGSQSVKEVWFWTTGWNITGAAFTDITTITSLGPELGTNTFTNDLAQFSDGTWTGFFRATVDLMGTYNQRDKNLTLTGGATYYFDHALTGDASTGWGLSLLTGTMRINAATPYAASAGGVVTLFTVDAKLELATTVAAAQALIGTKVINNTGKPLLVTDVGGGFTRITAAPEPSTIALLAAGAFAVAGRVVRRRRGAS